MNGSDVAMEIGPSKTSHITAGIWAVEAQQQNSVLMDVLLLVLDPEILIDVGEVPFREVLVALGTIIGEDDVVG